MGIIHAADLGTDMAVEEKHGARGAFDRAGGSDQQHSYRHQEAN